MAVPSVRQDRWWPGGKKEPIIPDLGDLSAFHSSQPTRFLFRFQPEEKGCRRPALSRDKGSFRLTARPLDGPKAPRLPSPPPPPSNLFPTSPPRTWKPYVQDVSHPDVSLLARDQDVSCRGVRSHACFRASPAATF